MSIKHMAATAATLMAVGLPVQAGAAAGADQASAIFRIHGVVPVLCQVRVSAIVSVPDAEGVADLGALEEACNAPRGYRVIVKHAQNLQGGALIQDGVRIPLSATGETVLTDSPRPNLRKMALAVDVGDQPERFSALGFRIEAKG